MSIVKLVLVFCLACIPGSYLNAFGDFDLCEESGRVSFVTEPFPEFVVNYDEVGKTFDIRIVPNHDDMELSLLMVRLNHAGSSISFPLNFGIVEDEAVSYITIHGDEEHWTLAIAAHYGRSFFCGPSVHYVYRNLERQNKE